MALVQALRMPNTVHEPGVVGGYYIHLAREHFHRDSRHESPRYLVQRCRRLLNEIDDLDRVA